MGLAIRLFAAKWARESELAWADYFYRDDALGAGLRVPTGAPWPG